MSAFVHASGFDSGLTIPSLFAIVAVSYRQLLYIGCYETRNSPNSIRLGGLFLLGLSLPVPLVLFNKLGEV
jgi:hypothetical protein